MQTKPPETAKAAIAALTEGFGEFSAQLQRAARFIIDNPREVGVHSMRQLAARAEVHPNTLVRLAQAIGFDGYDALRERFRDFMLSDSLGGFRDRARWLKELAAEGGTARVMSEMAQSTGANLDTMWRRQDAAQLEAAAKAMLEARMVYVLGLGGAYSLGHMFWYVARMAFEQVVPIPRHGSQPVDDIAWATPDDVLMALTFQPYRAETMTAVRMAREKGLTVIGVTDSVTSPLAPLSDHLLTAPTHTPQFFESHAAVTALLEGLLAVMVAMAGEDRATLIEEFHQRRVEAGLYEEHAALAQLG